MAAKPLPDQATLRQLLDYDPETGVFTWRSRPISMFLNTKHTRGPAAAQKAFETQHAGKRAFGYIDQRGYHTSLIWGRIYYAHRLAWMLHYGEDPVQQIDHINGVRSDNRIANLRVVSHTENGRNAALLSSNTSGYAGVSLTRPNRWIARIRVKGRRINLGTFGSFEEAVAAKKDAERLYGFHPNHGKRRTDPRDYRFAAAASFS